MFVGAVVGGTVDDVVFAADEAPVVPFAVEPAGRMVLVMRVVEVNVERTRSEPTVTPTESDVDTTTDGEVLLPVAEACVPLVDAPLAAA